MNVAPDAALSATASAVQDDPDSNSLISLQNVSIQNANIHYQDASGVKSSYQVQRFLLLGGRDKTAVTLNMKYNSVEVGLTGKTGSLIGAYQDWGGFRKYTPD